MAFKVTGANNKLSILALTLVLTCLSSCQQKNVIYTEKPLEQIYAKAYKTLKKGDYKEAAKEFDEVTQQYPYADWSNQAQLMSAYASYKAEDYVRSIGTLDTFLSLHPYHPRADYAYYLRALCYYDQVAAVDRTIQLLDHSFQALSDVIDRFPNTPYAQDALLKRDLIINYLSAHHLTVGKFYLRDENALGALKRFETIIANPHFKQSVYTAEALYRMVEVYLKLGLGTEAKNALYLLGKNFKDSTWYKEGYALLQKNGLLPGQSRS